MQGRSNNDSICWINTGMLFFWNLALSFVCHVLRLIRMNPIFFLNETFHQENKHGIIYSWSNDCITHFATLNVKYAIQLNFLCLVFWDFRYCLQISFEFWTFKKCDLNMFSHFFLKVITFIYTWIFITIIIIWFILVLNLKFK